MSFSRILSSFACLLTFISLTSCELLGRNEIAASNPTVDQLDSLDQKWGLPARKSRGGPRRSFQYVEPTSGSTAPPASASATSSAPSIPSRETVSGLPPISLNPEPPAANAPVVAPSTLR
jgi:hypothetical protein